MNYLFIALLALNPFFIQNDSKTIDKSQVVVNISNIRNTKGVIGIGIFKTEEQFKKDTPYLRLEFGKDELKDGKLTVSFDLPEGKYGIALIDDENRNGKMDFSFLIPQEGVGFSNYYHRGLTRPRLDAFKFYVREEAVSKVRVKMKYYN